MTLLFIEDPTRWDQDKIDFLEDAGKCGQKDPGEHHVKERKLINLFLNYPEGSAGSLMTKEFVDLKKRLTLKEILEKIIRSALDQETIYTCNVTDQNRKLEGAVSLKALALCDPQKIIESIMEPTSSPMRPCSTWKTLPPGI